ncbi:transcriptional regulator ToxR [Vibrio parahaemolyticus]|uniref:transcriptional regulator ToxR n=1 Tax=Vibrio parahaemolyticus TaxID=670 RepID=UPI00084AECBF|nr:transcriptional regulator ToxR [Vibrio parahaemolyticus]EGR3200835.1 transcriptional regulator [Vibrio parahaemolyticus]EKF6808540.1 transcriptional regulator ToxR [Vibrio parahaemolyticus]ODY82430.1 transcriptional regulator [Vibrio parahaemolyticus]
MTNIGTKFLLAQRFTFDPNSNSLADQQSGNEVVRLGSNESRILLMLAERPNEVLTRNELHEFVWREQGFEVDDSSLTQAISTLRKMLKDSTKSPEFVKTVPKRGYQLICTVERLNPLSSDSSSIEVEEPASDNNDASANEVETIVEPSLTTISDAIVEPEAPVVPEKAPVASAVNPWIPRVILFLALLLPICVLLFTNPAESQFRQIGEYQNVPVMTPVNHPQINNWLPSIEQCIERYVKHHAEDSLPVEVIATGGQNNQLILNYIHDSNHSYENVTLRIFAGQNDPTDICK